MQQAVEPYYTVLAFTKQIMKEGIDYGTIPGVDKAALQKPGAEKLCASSGSRRVSLLSRKWKIGPAKITAASLLPLLVPVSALSHGQLVGESDGTATRVKANTATSGLPRNTSSGARKETLVALGGRISDFDFAIEKAETDGRYGDPEAYWQLFRKCHLRLPSFPCGPLFRKPQCRSLNLSRFSELRSDRFSHPVQDVQAIHCNREEYTFNAK
jgi:hypothetical protein